MSYTITSTTAGSENVVHRTNTFIASSLAFGCHVGCNRRIFVVRLLFLSTAVGAVVTILAPEPLLLPPAPIIPIIITLVLL